MEPGTFTCSICGDGSRSICVYCTKDACDNHLCERCRRCSDCCECGVPIGSNDTGMAAVDEADVAASSFSGQETEVTPSDTQPPTVVEDVSVA